MITQRFYLKEYFPELGENGCNAYMDAYIPSAFENAGEALATKNSSRKANRYRRAF